MPSLVQPFKDGIVKLVKSLFDPRVLNDLFKDARGTKIADNPLNENFYKHEFQKLWKTISKKNVYKVDFDSTELIQKAIDHINLHLQVKTLHYVIKKGEQKNMMTQEDIEQKNSYTIIASENRRIRREISSSISYDLVGRISKKTSLTRRTVVAILKGLQLDVFEMFRINPEDFIAQVSRLINEQKATMVVEHITYSKAEGIPPYDVSIFTATKSDREFLKAYQGKKGVQDYMFFDSKGEENIARAMDIPSNEINIYAKLPRGFQIPTPVGNYAPDWAIVLHKGVAKHIYFVAETKGTMDTMDISPIEKSKIGSSRFLRGIVFH